MGRKSLKKVRQKEIIRAFYKVAKKEGLENVSIAKTAKALEITPGLIMHYFKTKEELMYGLIEYILDKYILIFTVGQKKKFESPKQELILAIDNIFSHRWNRLFDDGVSYSCYALVFRNKKIRAQFKQVLDSLRERLKQIIIQCNEENVLEIDNPDYTADMIFILVDGAYYYLSLVDDKEEYNRKLEIYKQRAYKLLNLNTAKG